MVEPLSCVELEGSVDDSEFGSDVDAEIDGQIDYEEIDDQVDDQSAPRRSERVRRRPNYYTERAFIVVDGALLHCC